MKHFLFILLILCIKINSFCEDDPQNYGKYSDFLKQYHFRIYSFDQEVGYIKINISTCNNSGVFCSNVESYTETPILSFLGGNKVEEIEFYDNEFMPLKSSVLTTNSLNNKKSITEMNIVLDENNNYICKISKNVNNKLKSKNLEINLPILTAGNVIPIVLTTWDFDKEKNIEYKFIDKNKLEIKNLKLSYIGKQNGYHKIKANLASFGANFNIYLNDNMDIIYAEGIGLKVYSEIKNVSHETKF
ncbi:MAG: hypothetical protein N2643_05375 [Endomicrobia bacterium]|nr:hypothetical protein [Endomicrobiia bacterium]